MNGSQARRFATTVVTVLLMTAITARADAAEGSGYSRKGADTCLGCHDDAALMGLFNTRHARPKIGRAHV